MTKTRSIPKKPKDELRVPEPFRERQQQAGVLMMSGPFVAQHKDEILDLIRDTVEGLEQKNDQAPSIRIAERPASSIRVTFTNGRLAGDIGRILYQKYWGELDLQVEEGGKSVRVTWWR